MFGHGLDVQNSKSVVPAGLSPLEGELVPAVEVAVHLRSLAVSSNLLDRGNVPAV